MNEVVVAGGCSVMSPKERGREIPYLVVKILTGGQPVANYKGNEDVVAIRWSGSMDQPFHIDDYRLAAGIANKINEGLMQSGAEESIRFLPETLIKFHRLAASALDEIDDPREKTKGIAMLKDQYGGSGWWRMVMPATYMDMEGWHVDISAAGINFDNLLEYDTIFVQRLHDWESYYILERLVKAGKRVVYDLDDDIFRIPMSNPASRLVGRDQQAAARECMRLAHAVTCTTEVMKERVVLENIDPSKIHVVPNALDADDRWLPLDDIGSPDGNLRIFWQGGATHAEDWMECIEAVDAVMLAMPNVILQIFGALPPIIQKMNVRPHWKGRVEYLAFGNIETYYETIHHIRADVGIAPLESTTFNEAKSPIKWQEYAHIGMATVASDSPPYTSVIEHGIDGMLVSGKDEWEKALLHYLGSAEIRRETVKLAREKVGRLFDLKSVAGQWEEVLKR